MYVLFGLEAACLAFVIWISHAHYSVLGFYCNR